MVQAALFDTTNLLWASDNTLDLFREDGESYSCPEDLAQVGLLMTWGGDDKVEVSIYVVRSL